MDFALSSNPSPSELADAVNYLLGNLGGANAQYNPVTGQITQNGVVIGYLYRYLWVKYAQSFDGSVGFSDSPVGATYYGLANSNSNVELTNPSLYAWTPASFGATGLFWFLTTGGRKITTAIATIQPSVGWSSDTGAAIDLDQISAVGGSIINNISNIASLGMDGVDGEDGQMGPPGPGRTSSYGELEIINNSTGTVCTTINTFYQITAGWTAGDTKNYIAGSSNLTSSIGGPAYTVCSASLQTTSSNQNYNIQIFKNGVAIPGHNGMMRLTNSTDVNTITCSGIIGVVNPGDVFDIRVQNQSSSGQTVTVVYANFCMINI